MRINKYLASCGVASRRASDQLIQDGVVKINGRICSAGDEVNVGEDTVSVNGKIISIVKKFDYYIMNKPKGYVCTVKDDKGRKTVMDLLPQNAKKRPRRQFQLSKIAPLSSAILYAELCFFCSIRENLVHIIG